MERMGMVIRIRPEKIAEYKDLHANAWPEILDMITRSNIRNYSIFLREPENLLFGYWEYHGRDFTADSRRMAEHDATRRWWALTDPCQEKLKSCPDDQWWAPMEMVFHHD